MSVVRSLTTPYVWKWTLEYTARIYAESCRWRLPTSAITEQNLTGIRDINQAPAGSDYNPACAPGHNSLDQLCLPYNGKFPFLSNIFQMGNVYRSNYNGLQVTLNARNYHGLSMVAGYTYSHALDDVGANWDFGHGYGLAAELHNVARGVRQQRLRHPAPSDAVS